jgi:hypothetical protein
MLIAGFVVIATRGPGYLNNARVVVKRDETSRK